MKVQFIVAVATVLLSAVPSAFAAEVSSSLIHDTSPSALLLVIVL
jgi:hypothetical protein